MERIKLGFVGLVSDHLWPVWGKGIIKEIEDSNKFEMVVAADKNPELLERIKNEYEVKKIYTSYEDMLQKEDLDAAVIGLPNSEKVGMIELLVEKGLHILVDKPMAVNVKQAERILKAVRKHDVKILVDYLHMWSPTIQKAYSLVQEGTIGKIFQLSSRIGNPGPELHGCSKYMIEWLFDEEKNGGGALIDYCCYGVNLCRWFFGQQPKSVTGVGGRYVKDNISAEDNACLLLEYPHAMGIIEASWSQFAANVAKLYPMPMLLLYGSKGATAVRFGEDTLDLIAEDIPEGKKVKAPMLPREKMNGPEYLAHCIQTDKPVKGMCSPEFDRDVLEVLTAGYESIEKNKKVYL